MDRCIYSRRCITVCNFLKTTRALSLPLQVICFPLSYIQRRHEPREHNRCFPQVCLHPSSSVPGEKGLAACSCTEPRCVLPGTASRLGILRKSRLLSSLQTDKYYRFGWLWWKSYLVSGKWERQAEQSHSSQNWNAIFVSKESILAASLLPPLCQLSERQFEMDRNISSAINWFLFHCFFFPWDPFLPFPTI